MNKLNENLRKELVSINIIREFLPRKEIPCVFGVGELGIGELMNISSSLAITETKLKNSSRRRIQTLFNLTNRGL